MKDFFTKMTTRQFFIYALIGCIAGDIALACFIYFKFTNFDEFARQFNLAQQILGQSGTSLHHLPKNFQLEMYQLIKKSVITMLGMYFLIHSVVYLSFWFKKPFSYYYVKMMCWFGPVICLLIIAGNLGAHPAHYYFFLQAPIYLLIALGMKYHPLPVIKKQE